MPDRTPPPRDEMQTALMQDAAIHEAMGALTAMGLWLAALDKTMQRLDAAEHKDMHFILQKSMGQHRRLVDAVVQLRDQWRRLP